MKYLHTMVRVKDIDESLDFYCNKLGLKEVRRKESEQGRYTLIFLAAENSNETTGLLELTYNWDQEEEYVKGNAWGHLALKVSDVYETSTYLKEKGVEFTKEPSPMKNGTRIIAFIKDPDGDVIELNEPLE